MASITNTKGRRTIQVVGADGKRRPIRLGKCDGQTAEGIKIHVERLAVAQITGMPMHRDTANWLRDIGDELHRRIAQARLCEPRAISMRGTMPLKQMLDSYIARRTDLKDWSIKMLRQCQKKLVDFFGERRGIGTITAADAADFKRHVGIDMSVAYVAKLVMIARQFFKDAVDSELLDKSPFSKIKPGSQKNPARQRFIPSAVIDKVIAAAPDIQWKLIIALARYGGLRMPTEALALRWSDVRWQQGRIIIHSSKTEHHVGKDRREIPLFPELKSLLMEAAKAVPEGGTYVISRSRDKTANFRTQLKRILQGLKIEPWPKLFQNLRSSRQTELTEVWPAHVVCAWMGNSELVARDHYLQLTDDHFAKAAGIAVVNNNNGQRAGSGATDGAEKSGAESGAAGTGFGSQCQAPTFLLEMTTSDPASTSIVMHADANLHKKTHMGDKGFEPLTPSV
jgi:integrase